ncbi:MAG: ATP-binding protein [Phycisphaerales bacterium JB052]
MKQPHSKHVRRSISRFRKLSLVSVIAIMLINFIMVHRISGVLDHGSASKINESGRMRLLSQCIRSTAFEIDTAVRNERWERLEPLYDQLADCTDHLKRNHDALLTQNTTETLFPNASQEQLDTIASIEVPYRRVISASKELQLLTSNSARRAPYLDQQTRNRISAALEEIGQAQGHLLPRIESLVQMFVDQSHIEIDKSITQSRAGLIVLALMLASMVLFIIEPTILIVRRQLRELDLATRRAQHADSVRWRLLTNMGHEFRTPMNAIQGFAELLEETSLNESERHRLAGSIQDSAAQLTTLIETMLDISAIESGELSITPTPARVSEILKPCVSTKRAAAEAKGLDFRVNIDSSCNTPVMIEPKRFAQVVSKLLENAVKFTPSGSICLDASIEHQTNSERIVVRISDTGIGISPEEHKLIFNTFHQTQNNLTREFGGSGLGLAFAMHIAQAMNGDISLESTPGEGSTFTLTIDAKPAERISPEPAHKANTPAPKASFANARILIVDDGKDNRVLLQHYFRNTDAQTDFAHDGKEAIERIRQGIEKQSPFDLVLMDMQMPILDGYASTQQLRTMGIDVPIIALTAHALEGDREQCLAAGCNEYLTKPISRAALFKACEAMLGTTTDTHRQAA